MNEIQIIQNQLATERLHFAEVANACAAALDSGSFAAGSDFARACADYFAFAITRLPWSSSAPPRTDATNERWREFLRVFNDTTTRHFAAVDELLTRNLTVTEWRALARIDADSIFTERARYGLLKATAP